MPKSIMGKFWSIVDSGLHLATVVWEKIWHEKFFHWMPGTTKIKHAKIFLPQRNRAIYNGL